MNVAREVIMILIAVLVSWESWRCYQALPDLRFLKVNWEFRARADFADAVKALEDLNAAEGAVTGFRIRRLILASKDIDPTDDYDLERLGLAVHRTISFYDRRREHKLCASPLRRPRYNDGLIQWIDCLGEASTSRCPEEQLDAECEQKLLEYVRRKSEDPLGTPCRADNVGDCTEPICDYFDLRTERYGYFLFPRLLVDAARTGTETESMKNEIEKLAFELYDPTCPTESSPDRHKRWHEALDRVARGLREVRETVLRLRTSRRLKGTVRIDNRSTRTNELINASVQFCRATQDPWKDCRDIPLKLTDHEIGAGEVASITVESEELGRFDWQYVVNAIRYRYPYELRVKDMYGKTHAHSGVAGATSTPRRNENYAYD